MRSAMVLARAVALLAVATSVLATLASAAVGPPRSSGLDARVSATVARLLEERGAARVIVALAPGEDLPSTLADRKAAVARTQRSVLQGIVPAQFVVSHRWRVVPALAGTVSQLGLEELLASSAVRRVGLDPIVHAELSESVPLIRADQVQAAGVTGRGVTVAVLDTGIDTDNPELADDLIGEHCFLEDGNGGGLCPNGSGEQDGPGSAEDDQGHGTAVSAMISSRGSTAPRGVAPDAKILAVKVLPKDGGSRASNIIAGLDWVLATRPDVKVVNMSLGGGLYPGDCDESDASTIATASAIDALHERGTVVVVASGNDGSASSMAAPACVHNALSVGATYDADGPGLAFSNCADQASTVDVVACFSNASAVLDVLAPGAMITHAKMGGGQDSGVGTSYASPHVAATAALLLQVDPNLSPDQIESILETTGVSITDSRNGHAYPRIDALNALNAVPSHPGTPPAPPPLPPGSNSLVDAGGDAVDGPDVTGVDIAASTTGLLRITVRVGNRTALGAKEALAVFLDADLDPTTGDPAGSDFYVQATASGRILHRWGGSWKQLRKLAQSTFADGTLSFSLNESELKSQRGLGVRVETIAGVGVADRAPNSRWWPYPSAALTVKRGGTGSGIVLSPDGQVDCGYTCTVEVAPGSELQLTARPDLDSRFAGWGGGCAGAGVCRLTVNGATSVTATFTRDSTRPRASAFASTGRRGRTARLRYRLFDDSGSAAAELRVRRGSGTLDVIRRRPQPAHGAASTAYWRVPAGTRRGRLEFCVRGADSAGNRSARSCAVLRIR